MLSSVMPCTIVYLVQQLPPESQLLIFLGDLRRLEHTWNLGGVLALHSSLALLLRLPLLKE